MEDQNEDIARMLDYCRGAGRCGFECHVDSQEAEQWVKTNKPHLEID
jgi:hypothetical protein